MKGIIVISSKDLNLAAREKSFRDISRYDMIDKLKFMKAEMVVYIDYESNQYKIIKNRYPDDSLETLKLLKQIIL